MAEYEVRVAPLLIIPELLYSIGCDPGSVFSSAGFNEADFRDGESRLPYKEAASLIDASSAVSHCDTFGLSLGQRFSLQQLGLIARISGSSDTVEAALRDLLDNFYLHDSGGILFLDKGSSLASLGYRVIVPRAGSLVHVHDMCIACLCLVLRSFCGADWSPAKVELTRAEPTDAARYKAFFRAPVVFGARTNALSFSKHWLSVPVPTSDGEKHRMLSLEKATATESAQQRVSKVVRRLLHQNLHKGLDSSCDIAESLGVHERSLRRRLARENTSFRELLEEARQTVSLQYLNDTELSISDVALALGYSGTDAFDHAFRRWHGMSPSQWRGLQTASETSK